MRLEASFNCSLFCCKNYCIVNLFCKANSHLTSGYLDGYQLICCPKLRTLSQFKSVESQIRLWQRAYSQIICHWFRHLISVCIVSQKNVAFSNQNLWEFSTRDHIKVRKKVKIRNRYNQVPRLTQNTTRESDKNTKKITYKSAKRPARLQQVITRLQWTDKTVWQACNINNKKGSQRNTIFAIN